MEKLPLLSLSWPFLAENFHLVQADFLASGHHAEDRQSEFSSRKYLLGPFPE